MVSAVVLVDEKEIDQQQPQSVCKAWRKADMNDTEQGEQTVRLWEVRCIRTASICNQAAAMAGMTAGARCRERRWIGMSSRRMQA